MIMIMAFFNLHGNSQYYDGTDYRKLRGVMVDRQIRSRGVTDDRVLKAMLKVERHLFVPEKYHSEAYQDHPLPIGAGQTISQPYIVAFMTEALDLKPTDKVLEIGTGSGYQAAVLAELCDSVYTVEIVGMLAEMATKTLNELHYTNVSVKEGDGYEGWPENAPYDAIIVTCAPNQVPEPLKDQLREGGKMIIPVGQTYAQELVLLEKKDGKLKQHKVLPVRFVPMVNEKGKRY